MANWVETNEITQDDGEFSTDKLESTRVFEVKYDGLDVTPLQASLATGVPPAYMPHSSNFNMLLLRKRAARSQDSPLVWVVTCFYSTTIPKEVAQSLSTPPGGGTTTPQQAAAENPLQRPARWKVKCQKYVVTAERDIYGATITNSAGEAVEPPPTRRKSRLVYEVQRNLPTWGCDLMADLVDSINENPFIGYGAREVYFEDCYAEQTYENGVRFFDVNATFVIDKETWNFEYLDAGWHELINDALVPILIRGQKPPKPFPLNGAGLRLPVGSTPQYRTKYIYPIKDFDSLGLFD